MGVNLSYTLAVSTERMASAPGGLRCFRSKMSKSPDPLQNCHVGIPPITVVNRDGILIFVCIPGDCCTSRLLPQVATSVSGGIELSPIWQNLVFPNKLGKTM